ncbi:MAG: HAMP domain-containing sensor histidine kinase, partial [Bryobacterales bacterium]|nr:HAMP domain-containing sensor histidine kinase [Bryobacterales bacterium]
RDPSVRAAALLRLGRIEKKLGHFEAALAAYSELARLGETRVEGLPAEMAAREARCRLYEQAGRVKELAGESAALDAGLRQGRWRIARATWQFYAEEAARWMSGPAPAPVDPNQLALAAAAEWVYQRWQVDRDSSGHQFLTLEDRPVMVVWKATASKLRAVVAGPRVVQSALDSVARDPGVSIAFSDAAGLAVLGRPATRPRVQVVRVAAATGLPWTLQVARTDPAAPSAQSRFLAAGGAILVLLLVSGGYFVFRAMAREMAVARLQSDFVSAVSHEFRSPLTSIRQLSHLLASDRVPDDDQRGRVYGALVRESERLHTLVEALLDFGRMEAGSVRYRLEPLDPVQLVTEVTEAFRLNPAAAGYNIHLRAEPGLPRVAADREALCRALWNLLDNAVKYSPENKDIHAEVAGHDDGVAIRVRDQGLGIPASQRKAIFMKFVRGDPASAVKGTGIGLAMVEHIVRGHRGTILLASDPGAGSTFTILLPAEKRS